MTKAMQGEIKTIEKKDSMFEIGMFETEQSFACLKPRPLRHEDSNWHPSLSQYMKK